jgi:hypothetical protein
MSRKTDAQIFEEIGLTRESVIAAAAGVRLPPKVREKDREKPRLICLVCKKPINALNCQPCRQADNQN